MNEENGDVKKAIRFAGQTVNITGFQLNESILIRVFDLQGKLLATYPIQQNRELYLGNEHYASGVYLITVEGNQGSLVRGKVFMGLDQPF
jgi:hypothetical protein